MHPPLDRPHPDCQDVIKAYKACNLDFWKKYTGGCKTAKVELDQCFRAEKKRLLDEMDKDLKQRKEQEEEMIKEAFGRSMTFSEYLKKDQEKRAAASKKLI
jgi:COX assembly mitochondrial protein 2